METNTLVDRIYEILKQKILRQEYVQDQKLNLTTLANELNVSNTPLREAISRLEKVGLVKIVPYRGTFVRGLSPSEVAEAYDVRIALETLAARLIAARRPAKVLAQLDAVHQRYEALFAGDDRNQTRVADLEFHRLIAEGSGNRTLIDLLQMLADWVTVFMQFRLPSTPRRAALVGEHARILAALHAGDPDAAGQAMQQHLVDNKQDLLGHLAISSDDTAQNEQYPDIWQHEGEKMGHG